VVYVQTAQDVGYDPAAPEKFIEARSNLDARRVAAVQKYLNTYTAGRHVDFQVLVHDPGEVGQAAIPVRNAIGQNYLGARGVLPAAGQGVVGGVPPAVTINNVTPPPQ
jgi:hypothetical protein